MLETVVGVIVTVLVFTQPASLNCQRTHCGGALMDIPVSCVVKDEVLLSVPVPCVILQAPTPGFGFDADNSIIGALGL